MDGVVVKKEIVEREIDKMMLIGALIIFAVPMPCEVYMAIECAIAGDMWSAMCAIVAVIFTVGYIRTMWQAYNNTWSEYIVEVENSVCLNEFSEKYEILDDEGDGVYRVREV